MSRWKAAGIHFALSLLVILALALALAATWYPPALVPAVGGLGLIALLAGVQACLGPLLTLIVFKSGKPGLRFDLAVISLLQVAALTYGLHVIFQARPVYLVFAKDRFQVVTAADIPPENLGKGQREEYKSLPLAGPKTVAVRRPDDLEEAQKILFSSVFGGVDLPAFPQYYEPYSQQAATAAEKARPLRDLLARDEATRTLLSAYLRDHHLEAAGLKYLPLQARQRDQTALIDGTSAELLGIVDIDPW